jgi:hypothetical protein
MKTEDRDWESSVLQCDQSDAGCPVCRFLSGVTDPTTLFEVIEVLDAKLSEKEKSYRFISDAFVAVSKALAESKLEYASLLDE